MRKFPDLRYYRVHVCHYMLKPGGGAYNITHVLSRQNDLHLLPGRVGGQLLVDEVLEVFVKLGHELRAGGDAVGVEMRL